MEATPEKKKDNTTVYFLYAAAAFFGLQFLLKPKRASAPAAVVTYPLTDPAATPPPVTTSTTAAPKASAAPTITWIPESFPLRKGMKGAKVKTLQRKLGITADGAFGDDTEAALLAQFGISTVTQDFYQSIVSTSVKTSPIPAPSTNTWIAESFPLCRGMKGPNIKILQQKLGITADGAFGANTEAAVKKRFGISTVSESQFKSFTQPVIATFSSLLQNILPKPAPAKDNSAILQNGSRGPDVYRLQRWLGFKDKKTATKGEPIADSAFGKQTLAALQKRTGKSTISLNQLNAYTKSVSGLGYLGEILITKRTTTILDGNLSPYRAVPQHTILGTRTMELRDTRDNKAYTQFQTIDGFHRWVETDAL